MTNLTAVFPTFAAAQLHPVQMALLGDGVDFLCRLIGEHPDDSRTLFAGEDSLNDGLRLLCGNLPPAGGEHHADVVSARLRGHQGVRHLGEPANLDLGHSSSFSFLPGSSAVTSDSPMRTALTPQPFSISMSSRFRMPLSLT